MRQNFIINCNPAGNKDLNVELLLGKKFRYELKDGNKLYCYSDNRTGESPQLIYDELKVWDAKGVLLAAHMQLNKHIYPLLWMIKMLYFQLQLIL